METEKINKLSDNIYEIRKQVVNEEVVTVNSEVLDNDIKSAQENVARKTSELNSAEAQLEHFMTLKQKLSKVK